MKTRTAKRSRGGKTTKDEGLLTSAAESIGSTIGAIVGSATAARNAMIQGDEMGNAKRQGKPPMRKAKQSRRRTKVKR